VIINLVKCESGKNSCDVSWLVREGGGGRFETPFNITIT
jgi:hypothetical protein